MRIEGDTLRKVQLKQLEILLEIQRVCEQHHIPFFLAAGTLLGAVRHKGFIPWDDDIDIVMLRKDYIRFLTVAARDISEQYFVESSYTNPDYVYSFCKVKANDTVYMEQCTAHTDIHQGIWVDVFPLDTLSEIDHPKIQKRMTTLSIYQTAIDYNAGIISLEKPLSKAFFTLMGLVWKHRLIARKESVMQQKSNATARYVIDYNCIYGYQKSILPVSMYEKPTLVEFEGHHFLAPADYDMVLAQLYGDYMRLPPVEKRTNGHGIIRCEV